MFDWFEKIGAERGLQWSEAGLLLFAAIVAIGLIGEYRKAKDDRWTGLSDVFELLVIAGVVGEVIFDGLIFGFSGRLDAIRDVAVMQANSVASDAYKVGNIAREHASILELESKKEQKTILEQAQRIIDLEIQFGIRVPKVETNVSNLQSAVKKSAEMQYPQDIDEGDLRRATRGLRSGLRNVTLIRLNDPIAGPYADKIKGALERLKPKFKVYVEDLPSSSFRGVIVCENGEGDRKVGNALKTAGIVSLIKKMPAKECERPEQAAPAPQLVLGLAFPLGEYRKPRSGTVIFVGHRRLAPP